MKTTHKYISLVIKNPALTSIILYFRVTYFELLILLKESQESLNEEKISEVEKIFFLP